MLVDRIEGTTRVLGKAQGYLGLPVRDELIRSGADTEWMPCMVTSWSPTPGELERLNAGASVLVRIIGTGHPPIMVDVSAAPELAS